MHLVLRISFALLFLSLCQPALAQYYEYGESTGTDPDFDYTTIGTTVLSITSDDVYSDPQTIPFPWQHYGQAKTTYYVSDNGYITFASSPGASDPNNTALPNASGPNDAIYAFWDDLGVVAGTGSPDKVETWTYGEAPLRVHVIQWFSVTPGSGSGFVYAAIRLYECGDFDVVLNYGNATGMTATIGTENATGSTGTQVSGSPNLSYPAIGSAGDDDVVYTFYWSAIQYDLSVTGLDLGDLVTPGDNEISGTLANLGNETVTGFELVYQVDGGPSQIDTISGVSIPPSGGIYNFTHSTLWNVPTGGVEHEIVVWAQAINVSFSDQRPCNDTYTTSVLSANDIWGFKRVLLEVFTGAWCGWCPDGDIVRSQIVNDFGQRVVAVDIHDGDAMEIADGIRTTFGVSAYPSGMVDRVVFSGEPDEPHSRGSWSQNVHQQLSSYTPLNVGVTSSFNPGTRQVDVTVDASFTDFAGGDIRFVCMVMEDNVVGSGTGYDQTNYLNTTAGHPYFGAGDPILGYNHRYVLRDISSAVGNPAVISTPAAPGDTAMETFVFTLPPDVDENQVTVIGMVAKYGDQVGQKSVANVISAPLGETREVPLFASSFNSGSTNDWTSTTE